MYNGAGDQSYYFWIESFNTMTNSSKIWIKIPTLTGGGAITPDSGSIQRSGTSALGRRSIRSSLFDAFDTVGINDEGVDGRREPPTQSDGSLRPPRPATVWSAPPYPYHSIGDSMLGSRTDWIGSRPRPLHGRDQLEVRRRTVRPDG